MPPRYAYYTILIDDQPTAFRAADREDLLPTFKRLLAKNPAARMVWFQNGKIWNSRLEAQEAMRVRGERGRAGDSRQGQRERREGKLEWKPLEKLEWKPRSEVTERPKLEWRPKDQKLGAEGRESRRSVKREGVRTSDWRPGGEHRDPRQKYKDARKAKWTRFKQNVRKRWESKQTRRKKDEE